MMTVNNLFLDDDFSFPHISEREMNCERLLFNTTEDILLAMEDMGFSQADIARKLGKSSAYVSQLLDGTRNMTLKTLSDIAYALGAEVKVVILKNGVDVSHQIVCERRSYTSTSHNIVADPKHLIKMTIQPSGMDFVGMHAYANK